MPVIDHESSTRLRLLNFPLIIGVVYIHAFNTTISFAGRTLGTDQLNYPTDFIRILISQGIARISVPLFFLVSGYLFVAGCHWSLATYGKKLASRARTLLVPFLFWSILGVVIRFIGQSVPILKPYFDGDGSPVAEYSFFHLVDAVVGLTRVPESYHLWFIRDLMLLMILSPLLIAILRYLARPFLLTMFLVWITAKWPISTPDGVGVLFFSAGCYLAMKGRSLFALDKYGVWFSLVYLMFLFADVVWYDKPFNLCLHRCGIVAGIVTVLFATRMVLSHERMKSLLLWLSGASFFVYAAHEPLLGIMRTLSLQFLPIQWPYAILLIYLLLPLTVIAFLVAVHGVLTVHAPKILSYITGGR